MDSNHVIQSFCSFHDPEDPNEINRFFIRYGDHDLLDVNRFVLTVLFNILTPILGFLWGSYGSPTENFYRNQLKIN